MTKRERFNATYKGTIVNVKFSDTAEKGYSYKCHLDDIPDLKCGDLVLVPVGNNFKVAKVIAIGDEAIIQDNLDVEYKWVIWKVNLTHYKKLVLDEKTTWENFPDEDI